jgi:GNAT superfamily N-acetyltransferase
MHVASCDDLQQVVDLLEESAAWMVSIGIKRWLPGSFIAGQDKVKEAIGTETVYVWRVAGKVLATIRLTENDDSIWGTEAGPALYVHKMSVSRSLKGNGFGPRLLNWAEAEAVSRKFSALRLDCWAENARLCSFYDSCGFRRVGLIRVEGWLHQLFEKRLTPRL